MFYRDYLLCGINIMSLTTANEVFISGIIFNREHSKNIIMWLDQNDPYNLSARGGSVEWFYLDGSRKISRKLWVS